MSDATRAAELLLLELGVTPNAKHRRVAAHALQQAQAAGDEWVLKQFEFVADGLADIDDSNRPQAEYIRQAIEGIRKQIEAQAGDGGMSEQEKINHALQLILQYGSIDGGHHKQWVLDQVVRILSPDYKGWVAQHNDGEEGPETYEWSAGIAP